MARPCILRSMQGLFKWLYSDDRICTCDLLLMGQTSWLLLYVASKEKQESITALLPRSALKLLVSLLGSIAPGPSLGQRL
jgi:hypothetical protein